MKMQNLLGLNMPKNKKTTIEVPETITGNSKLDEALVAFPEMNNKDALDVSLALQQLVRGQNAILNNLDSNNKMSAKLNEELSKLRQRMDEYDNTERKFNEDKDKFIADVINKAERKKVKGDKKDKIIAKATNDLTEGIKLQRANITSDNLSFEAELARMPKVKILSHGKLETTLVGGVPTPAIFPEEIRVKHKIWRLPPGQEVEVPQIVAVLLEERRRIEAETRERSQVLAKNLDSDKLNEEMRKINKKYNSTGSLPYQGESYDT